MTKALRVGNMWHTFTKHDKLSRKQYAYPVLDLLIYVIQLYYVFYI